MRFCDDHQHVGSDCPECDQFMKGLTQPAPVRVRGWSETTRLIAGKLSEAVYKDETEDGCDISAGLYGTHASALIAQIADALDAHDIKLTLSP